MKDVNFYNQESEEYSHKRYEGSINNFIKYFFNRRLNLSIDFFQKSLKYLRKDNLKILDIGCADGFVLDKFYQLFPENIGCVVGIDTSPLMIEKAKKTFSNNDKFSFYVRGEEKENEFDMIIELGVPISDWEEEFSYVLSRLKTGGVYIFSTPGSKNSLYSRIKDDFHVANPLSFYEFDKLTEVSFEVLEDKHYAFFIPLLWRIPSFARLLQPIAEFLFSFIAPFLCHEKIYILRKRDNQVKEAFQKSQTRLINDFLKWYVYHGNHKAHMMLLIRYLFSGGLSFSTNIGLLLVFTTYFDMWYLYASTLAFVLSVIVSFISQKFFTFKDRTSDKIPNQIGLYILIALFNIGANAIMMFTAVDIFNLSHLFSQVISAGLIAVWSLFFYKYVIFKRK